MLPFLSRYKLYVVFVAIMMAGLSLVFFVSAGYYPIAFVNGKFVSARRFEREYAAADFYYRRVLETYGDKASSGSNLKPADLEASTMGKIIEDILVDGGARGEIGSDLDNLVRIKLGRFSSDQELEKAASGLYGLNKGEFWNFVLVPQAERDILSGHLFLRGQKVEDWIAEAKKLARVFIFSNELRWSGDKVEAKKS